MRNHEYIVESLVKMRVALNISIHYKTIVSWWALTLMRGFRSWNMFLNWMWEGMQRIFLERWLIGVLCYWWHQVARDYTYLSCWGFNFCVYLKSKRCLLSAWSIYYILVIIFSNFLPLAILINHDESFRAWLFVVNLCFRLSLWVIVFLHL